MSQPVATITAMHVCPMVTGVVPHVGGPVAAPASPTVLAGALPAAGMGSMVVCVGPPDSVVMGAPTVLAGSMPIARMGDSCAHGGTVVVGQPTILA